LELQVEAVVVVLPLSLRSTTVFSPLLEEAVVVAALVLEMQIKQSQTLLLPPMEPALRVEMVRLPQIAASISMVVAVVAAAVVGMQEQAVDPQFRSEVLNAQV
jgi:hypothetical protein